MHPPPLTKMNTSPVKYVSHMATTHLKYVMPTMSTFVPSIVFTLMMYMRKSLSHNFVLAVPYITVECAAGTAKAFSKCISMDARYSTAGVSIPMSLSPYPWDGNQTDT